MKRCRINRSKLNKPSAADENGNRVAWALRLLPLMKHSRQHIFVALLTFVLVAPFGARAFSSSSRFYYAYDAYYQLKAAAPPLPLTPPPQSPPLLHQVVNSERPPEFYITETIRINLERQRLQQSYNRLQSEFRAAVAARDREGASRLSREAEGVVEQLQYLDGMHAITRLWVGDIGPLAHQMYTASGNRMQLQPRSDGTFNIYLDGQVVSQGISRQQLENSARSLFDTRYRQRPKPP
jgi:hypothetical protein